MGLNLDYLNHRHHHLYWLNHLLQYHEVVDMVGEILLVPFHRHLILLHPHFYVRLVVRLSVVFLDLVDLVFDTDYLGDYHLLQHLRLLQIHIRQCK